jgi:1-acyl-sn-glycerol-3-phosphate acyltransferase
MIVLRWLYTAYASFLFVVLFALLFPLFLIPIFSPRLFHLTGILNRVWAYIFFTCLGMPFKIIRHEKLSRKKQYVLVANHFSYLDIASMGLNPIDSVFVGKNDMEKVLLFGFMYRKLHITVDRASLSSKYNTLKRSLQAIDEGKSLVIFPEGGILTKEPPVMVRFKDGAFRVAIEKQVPVVPVTISNNWIILPDKNPLLLRWGVMKIIFHEPLETVGLTLADLESLKQRAYDIIDQELNYENRSRSIR